MPEMVPSSVIMTDMAIYWVISMIVIWLMDRYARRKIGGKDELGYKVLRIPKFWAMMGISAYTIVIVTKARMGFTVSNNVHTFLGLPYFIAWIFYLVNMLRRVRAETRERRLG